MNESLHLEIKQALVRSLRLPMMPQEIGDDTPLFGPGGLGLDSVDVLEVVLELERSFGVKIEDQDTGMQALRSVKTIADFIRANREHTPTA
jgi:acyl carrier protein